MTDTSLLYLLAGLLLAVLAFQLALFLRRPDAALESLRARLEEALRNEQRDGRLELRVFNPTSEATDVRVAGRKGWLMDLKGTPLQPFQETVTLPAGRIATLALDEQ